MAQFAYILCVESNKQFRVKTLEKDSCRLYYQRVNHYIEKFRRFCANFI